MIESTFPFFFNLATCMFFVLQVTGLAMCKHNKNDMFLRKMSTYWRHTRADQLFYDYPDIPLEAREVISNKQEQHMHTESEVHAF